MAKLAKILGMSVCLSLLAIGLSFLTSTPAPASSGPQPVNVAQVSVSSVPVSGTVNIGNSPSVSISNTPSVNVANSPMVSFAAGSSLNVNNALDSQSNPTPLITLEGSQPYEDSCNLNLNGQQFGTCQFRAVPAAKRLVVQEVDAYVVADPGLRPAILTFGTGGLNHNLSATFMGTLALANPGDVYATHQQTRLYASQGLNPDCNVVLTDTTNILGFLSCQLSGFLVDVP